MKLNEIGKNVYENILHGLKQLNYCKCKDYLEERNNFRNVRKLARFFPATTPIFYCLAIRHLELSYKCYLKKSIHEKLDLDYRNL